jgi:hypothetical protein
MEKEEASLILDNEFIQVVHTLEEDANENLLLNSHDSIITLQQ